MHNNAPSCSPVYLRPVARDGAEDIRHPSSFILIILVEMTPHMSQRAPVERDADKK